MKHRMTQITIHPEGTPLFDHRATTFSIVDEGPGEIVCIRQCPSEGVQEIIVEKKDAKYFINALKNILDQVEDCDE